MSEERVLEGIIAELSQLAARRIEGERDGVIRERAKGLCVRLREMGYSNGQIRELARGAWSVHTIKRWTGGTRVRDPSPRQSAEALLAELIARGISLDQIKQSISINEILRSKSLELNDVSELLAETSQAGIGAEECKPPQTISIREGALDTARYVSEEGARDAWRWAIFPEGFSAPKLVSVAKLQAWSLKPALPLGDR